MYAERCARGDIRISVPPEEVIEAIDIRRPKAHDFESIDEIRALLRSARLEVESETVAERRLALSPAARDDRVVETRYVALVYSAG
jgi:hypothetical protein